MKLHKFDVNIHHFFAYVRFSFLVTYWPWPIDPIDFIIQICLSWTIANTSVETIFCICEKFVFGDLLTLTYWPYWLHISVLLVMDHCQYVSENHFALHVTVFEKRWSEPRQIDRQTDRQTDRFPVHIHKEISFLNKGNHCIVSRSSLFVIFI